MKNMNYCTRLALLQKLANKLDNNEGTQLESEAFDCILEMLNEQNQIKNSGPVLTAPSKYKPGTLRFLDRDSTGVTAGYSLSGTKHIPRSALGTPWWADSSSTGDR